MNTDYTMLKRYYQFAFKFFDEKEGTKTVQWNWAAAFFGPFWVLTKGCKKNGILFLVVYFLLALATTGSIAGPFFIYYGCRGNWLFYKKFKENKDIWI